MESVTTEWKTVKRKLGERKAVMGGGCSHSGRERLGATSDRAELDPSESAVVLRTLGNVPPRVDKQEAQVLRREGSCSHSVVYSHLP